MQTSLTSSESDHWWKLGLSNESVKSVKKKKKVRNATIFLPQLKSIGQHDATERVQVNFFSSSAFQELSLSLVYLGGSRLLFMQITIHLALYL